METAKTVATETAAPQKSPTPSEVFGQGRYSNAMKELYRDCVEVLGLPENQARKVAKNYGSDLGRLEASGAKITFGSLKEKDRTITLKESVTVKGVILTHSLCIAKTAVLAKEMEKYGMGSVDVTFQSQVTEWLTKGE